MQLITQWLFNAAPQLHAYLLHRAVRHGLQHVYSHFAIGREPWVAEWFDEHFLLTQGAATITEALQEHRRPEPVELATRWRAQFHISNASADVLLVGAIQVATDLLDLLEPELNRYCLPAVCKMTATLKHH